MTKQEGIIKYQAIGCLLRMGYSALWSLDDLKQEGLICLEKAKETWRPDGGANFNSYLTTLLIHRFAKIVRKNYREQTTIQSSQIGLHPNCDARVDGMGEPPDTRAFWSDPDTGKLIMKLPLSLSPEAKQFLILAVNPPPSLRDIIRLPKSRIRHVLRTWLGWPMSKVNRIERELRATI